MKPINNWENVKPAGNRENLPAGGYVCQIKSVKEVTNKSRQGTHLEMLVEVAEGDFRGFFEADYRAQTGEDKFWGGIVNQNVPDETSPKFTQQAGFFKRFTSDIEESNPGYHWAWDEKTLVGKLIGVIFAEREKRSQRGNVYTVTNADSMTTIDNIRKGNYKVPEIKRLEPSSTPFSSFAAPAQDDGELPF